MRTVSKKIEKLNLFSQCICAEFKLEVGQDLVGDPFCSLKIIKCKKKNSYLIWL